MTEFLVVLLAGIFFASAVGKFSAPQAAQAFIELLGVPGPLARPAVQLTALVECAVSIALFAGRQVAAALLVATLLGCCFVLIQLAGLRVHGGSCKCFGKLDAELSPGMALARAAAVTVLAAIVSWLAPTEVGAFGPARLLAGGCGAATFILCFHLIDEVHKFRRTARASHTALLSASRAREAKHVAT
jgi:hypothetical protein